MQPTVDVLALNGRLHAIYISSEGIAASSKRFRIANTFVCFSRNVSVPTLP
jgi:hypothetical protein